MTRPVRWVAWTIATWFGCGRCPWAPGTAGTLGAIPLYFLAARYGHAAVALAALGVTAAGVWAASVVSRELRVKDPQLVVVDEVAGLLVTMLPVEPSWTAVGLGVLVFRFLDILKPWPIRRFEALPAGWGIVADDVVAGLVGGGVMAALRMANRVLT
jgi:phosphatidylglycerophosphatase A